MALSPLERCVLAFEAKPPRRKDEVIRRVFGVSSIRYHQVLVALLDRPDAEAYDPATVRRTRRALAAATDRRLARR